jgi:hypothetical protein
MPELVCTLIAIAPVVTASAALAGQQPVPLYVDAKTLRPPQAGSIFAMPDYLNEPWKEWLSDQYWKRHSGHRAPIVVVLPTAGWHCVDWMQVCDRRMYGGWDVAGDLPLISVTPSINIDGQWHGWLANGVLRW